MLANLGHDAVCAQLAKGCNRIKRKIRRLRKRLKRTNGDRSLNRIAGKIRFHEWRVRWRWNFVRYLIRRREEICAYARGWIMTAAHDIPEIADTVGRWRDDEANRSSR